jgi:fatty acid-binding protein DegV
LKEETAVNRNIILASDSTTDLNAELIALYDLKILPLTVALGGKSYADGTEMDPDTIYAHYEQTGELPKTAAPNISDFYEFFSKHTADGSAVIFLAIKPPRIKYFMSKCLFNMLMTSFPPL